MLPMAAWASLRLLPETPCASPSRSSSLLHSSALLRKCCSSSRMRSRQMLAKARRGEAGSGVRGGALGCGALGCGALGCGALGCGALGCGALGCGALVSRSATCACMRLTSSGGGGCRLSYGQEAVAGHVSRVSLVAPGVAPVEWREARVRGWVGKRRAVLAEESERMLAGTGCAREGCGAAGCCCGSQTVFLGFMLRCRQHRSERIW